MERDVPPVKPDPEPRLDYQEIFQYLPEGVFTIDTLWRITSFNRTAEGLTGYNKDEVIGRHCWEVFCSELCHKGCPLGVCFETGKLQMDQEVLVTNRHGVTKTLIVNVNILQDKDGTIQGGIETFRPPPAGEHILSRSHAAFEGLIGKSPSMQSIFQMLPDVAASEANVLLCGESGTGKEVLARAIHRHSCRSKGPFVAVNCSALAESLLESELFGHEKGAFTGADSRKLGRFELARGGTLFLDEIGDLKQQIQVKLLRVIEEREFERVGGTRSLPLDARIISATNKDLAKALGQNLFRDDLYFRLRTVPFYVPPLRKRPEDIPPLVSHFLKILNQRYHKQVRAVDPKVMRIFMKHDWPGNIRELERTLEYAFVFVKGPVIFERHLPEITIKNHQQTSMEDHAGQAHKGASDKQSILLALSKSDGNRQHAADMLGISRTSLWRRMKEFNLT
ncbi:MAG: sigma 54-interacting transcriptional regulator [Desulfovermiculus sp.]